MLAPQVWAFQLLQPPGLRLSPFSIPGHGKGDTVGSTGAKVNRVFFHGRPQSNGAEKISAYF